MLVAVDFQNNSAVVVQIIDECLMLVKCDKTGELIYVDRELQVKSIYWWS